MCPIKMQVVVNHVVPKVYIPIEGSPRNTQTIMELRIGDHECFQLGAVETDEALKFHLVEIDIGRDNEVARPQIACDRGVCNINYGLPLHFRVFQCSYQEFPAD